METGILYLVATPIGNIKDITLRAVEILEKVPIIACEDTRRTGMLLQKILELSNTTNKIIGKPKLLSYYEENEVQRIPEIIAFLKNGNNIALISDAGTPAVSDPGFKLIRECIRENLKIEVVPGASSVLTSLLVSGLPTDKFLFVGYLPRKDGHKHTFLENLKKSLDTIKTTVIIFEAPHRLLKTLNSIESVFGDISIVVTRELTKMHEEVIREPISCVTKKFKKRNPKGEFVILFHPTEGNTTEKPQDLPSHLEGGNIKL